VRGPTFALFVSAVGLRDLPQTAYNAINTLVSLGIARELSGQRRGRVWAYEEYLGLLAAGTEPRA